MEASLRRLSNSNILGSCFAERMVANNPWFDGKGMVGKIVYVNSAARKWVECPKPSKPLEDMFEVEVQGVYFVSYIARCKAGS